MPDWKGRRPLIRGLECPAFVVCWAAIAEKKQTHILVVSWLGLLSLEGTKMCSSLKVTARKRRSIAVLYPAGVGDPCEDPKPQELQELPLVLALRPGWLPGRSGRWKVVQGLRVQGRSARWLDSAVPLFIGTRQRGQRLCRAV